MHLILYIKTTMIITEGVTAMEKYYLGLDGGSVYLKAVLMKDKKVGTMVYPTGIDNNGVAKKIVAAL